MKRRNRWRGLSGVRHEHADAFHAAFEGARDTADTAATAIAANRCGAALQPLVEHFLNQGALEAHFVELGRPGSGPQLDAEQTVMTTMREVRRSLFAQFEARCGLRPAAGSAWQRGEGGGGGREGGMIEF